MIKCHGDLKIVVIIWKSTSDLMISDGTNVAVNKPAWQSSTAKLGFATNAVAINRSSDVKFARTAISDSPWWIVDLEAEFEITEILFKVENNGKIVSSSIFKRLSEEVKTNAMHWRI